MKKILFSLLFLFALASYSYSQNYLISFTGSGASTAVDSVKVENLTQCKSITISGSDVLNLVATIGINEMDSLAANNIRIFPNPSAGNCFAEFKAISKGIANIELYDMGGKRIVQIQPVLNYGFHAFGIGGLSNGIYTLKVESKDYCYNSKIVSIGGTSESPAISQIETNVVEKTIGNSEDKKLSTVMQYTNGDVLKITGKSGFYRTVVTLVPNSSQTLNFTFVPCTDANGNHYSVVQIGTQWWMAENLNAGTYATITTPQLSGTKFCMDVNGVADPDCPMGGLYEWANLMQGATGCNGTGAPPNDECTTPVKGLCPNGWHIPSHYEWTTLERSAGSNPSAFPYDMSTISLLGTDEGGNLKEACSNNWWAPNTGASNLSGFTGLPGGDTWNGVFEDFGQSGYFWTSSETFFMAWVHALNCSLNVIGRSSYAVESGFSCRCVKD